MHSNRQPGSIWLYKRTFEASNGSKKQEANEAPHGQYQFLIQQSNDDYSTLVES